MANLFSNGSIIAWILGFLAVEAAVLLALRMKSQLPLVDVLAALGAGAGLLLALRSALRGEGWTIIAFWLLIAFGAHLLDLNRRFIFNRSWQKR